MEYYFEQAAEAGVTEEEMGAVQSIVMTVSAGRVNAQVRDLREKE
jgi:hypothetical protein